MQTSEKMKTVLFLIAVMTAVSTALVVRNTHQLRKRIGRQAPVTAPSVDCICVAFNLCSANFTVNPNGITLIDIRKKKISPCEHYLDVCCKKEDMILQFKPSTLEPSPNKPPSSSLIPHHSSASGSTVIPTSADTTTPTLLSTSIPTNSASSTSFLSNPSQETNSTFDPSTSNSSLRGEPTTNESAPDLLASTSPFSISSSDKVPSSQSTTSPLHGSPTANVPSSTTPPSSTDSLNSAITIITMSPKPSSDSDITPLNNISLSIPSPNNPTPRSPSTGITPDNAPTETSPLFTTLPTNPQPTPPSTGSPLTIIPIANTFVSASNDDESSSPNSSTSSNSKLSELSNIPSIISPSSDNPLTSSSETDISSTDSPIPETNQPSNVHTTYSLLSSTPATDTSSSNVPSTGYHSSDTATTTNSPSSIPPPISPATVGPSSTDSEANDKLSVNNVSLTEDSDTLVNPPRAVTKDNYVSRGCGYRNNFGIGFRIIGNKFETQFAEFPWVVALLRDDEFICGGSLIHPKVVLTGAHCVRGASVEQFVARAGEWDRNTTKEILPHQDRKIDEIIAHEDFHSGALLNDVALLILKEPMTLTDNVDVVCLPTQDFEFGEMAACVASGWGKDNYDSQSYQQILKKVYVPLIESRDTCQTLLRETRLGQTFELDESFLCAGGKDQDTCKGDGGGPLMCISRDNIFRYHQAGIVAWGIGCGDGTPGVYAKVSHFRDWIDSQLKKRDIAL